MTLLSAPNAIAYLQSKGLSKGAAIGICAVLSIESGLNPTAVNNSGTDKGGVLNPKGAYGIAQWNGPRQTDLANFAKLKNLSPADTETQLAFILTECANSYPHVWAAITDPATTYQEMIKVFVEEYERPAKPATEIAAALKNADAWYPLIGGTPSPIAPLPAPPAVSGNTALEVAKQVTAARDALNAALKLLNVAV